jgi:hypothetical protein
MFRQLAIIVGDQVGVVDLQDVFQQQAGIQRRAIRRLKLSPAISQGGPNG